MSFRQTEETELMGKTELENCITVSRIDSTDVKGYQVQYNELKVLESSKYIK